MRESLILFALMTAAQENGEVMQFSKVLLSKFNPQFGSFFDDWIKVSMFEWHPKSSQVLSMLRS